MGPGEIERIEAFEHRFTKAQATTVTEFGWGFAVVQADFPHSYDHNKVVVTSHVDPTELCNRADDVLGGAGLAHRFIKVCDGALGQQHRPYFEALGYEHESLVIMIDRGDQPEPPVHAVHAVSAETMRATLMADWRRNLPDAHNDVIAQLADRTGLYSRASEVTFLAVFDGDQIVARVDLYVDPVDRIAQIESLNTHPDARGQGFADSVLREARIRARNAGCSLSYLVADQTDWPQNWYGRLGFEAAHRRHNFILAA